MTVLGLIFMLIGVGAGIFFRTPVGVALGIIFLVVGAYIVFSPKVGESE